MLDEAQREILLIGYAVHNQPRVVAALHSAADRGVEITMLLERPADKPRYTSFGSPFRTCESPGWTGLACRRMPGCRRGHLRPRGIAADPGTLLRI